ncbi:hypothetical protein IU443_12720 [Nocardia farcinica]|uniref:hypothetical protein n=1 Tax=Nocardia farcinica TaxID=37329 RepID=UPI000A3A7A84|nr:hypothetical protein [Nocardia farcinica]MBA4857523.1 hypothetical protein [Nocardia farcinica]MBC9816178.1 hypothetical protein [Nocardia farcinica]MBF6072409.1 hypothetical protein [Nocardia farcinica]MBF6262419.1 hypothetical protein [Nocardia farcinica]MBF6280959.1 hypothetical protein [Nocardia farcinica]
MSYAPDPDIVLQSVIDTLERDIEPAVATEHAASLCRTAAQMLRQVTARLDAELPVLVEDSDDLRSVLGALGIAVPDAPPARWPDVAATRAYVAALEGQLAELVAGEPDENAPVRVAARAFVARQLRRRLPWERDAFTGPRR